MLELDAGVIGREFPVGFGVMGIAISLPCGDLVDEDLLVGDGAVETLGGENGEFRFPYRANCRALAYNAIRTARRDVLPCLAEKPRTTMRVCEC